MSMWGGGALFENYLDGGWYPKLEGLHRKRDLSRRDPNPAAKPENCRESTVRFGPRDHGFRTTLPSTW